MLKVNYLATAVAAADGNSLESADCNKTLKPHLEGFSFNSHWRHEGCRLCCRFGEVEQDLFLSCLTIGQQHCLVEVH
jgi:hypothetical protein